MGNDSARIWAAKIAVEHLRKCNPSMWDGTGDKPEGFKQRIATYPVPVSEGVELDISFEQDDDAKPGERQWTHYCKLRDPESGELMSVLHGYGIDSTLNLADTIEDICSGLSFIA